MLQPAILRENKEDIIERFKKRNIDTRATIDEIIQLDEQRKTA